MKARLPENPTLIVCLLIASTVQSFAIEGLKLTVVCPDVVLSWPSVEGETYIVQHRETLDTSSTWVTLTNALPAEIGTNLTIFVHTNRVDCPTGQIFGIMMSGGGGDSLLSYGEQKDSLQIGPLVVPKDGSKAAMPLNIYPPGLDLSGRIIIWPDGSTDDWSSELVEKWRAIQEPDFDGPEPVDAGGSPGCGFYQVVRDGVHVVGLTNLTDATLSGNVTVTFEAGNADPNGPGVVGVLNNATLVVNGTKFAGANILRAPPGRPWHFSMDTAYLENGTHSVQLDVCWKKPGVYRRPYVHRWSETFTITVSNEVYYPQWEPAVGEADIGGFFLRTVYADAPYEIEITDANSNHVQTLSGYATNGAIEAYWNLVDTNGVTRNDADADPVFNSTTRVAAATHTAAKKNPRKDQRRKNWPEHGKWTIAYQDFFKFDYSGNDDMTESMWAFASIASSYGGVYLRYPPATGDTNDIGQTFPMRYQKTNHMDTNITAAALLKDDALLVAYLSLTNSRNFYYNGHGDVAVIGDDATQAFLNEYIHHRYRFVFLDGCNTANGDLDKAFGINGPGRFALIYYQNTGIRPAAFVGYSVEVDYGDGQPINVNGVDYDQTIPWQVPGFIFNFLFYWDDRFLLGWPLIDALDQAADDLPPVPGFINQPGRNLQVYGYDVLGIDDYNWRTAWP